MYIYLKTLLVTAAVAGFYVPATVNADFRDYNTKAWAQAGRQSSSRSARRSPSMYRSTAPVIVRSEPAPSAVAQAPTERRTFSYEPSQPAASGNCHGAVTTEQAPAMAQRSTGVRRSFSYEPSMSGSYLAPRMRSQSARTPAYLLPKTDPNKYRTH